MAEPAHTRIQASQDTGNPVLDSLVNIVAGTTYVDPSWLDAIHAKLLELAAKEPGGLRVRDAGRPVSWTKKGKSPAGEPAADEPQEDFGAR